MKLNIAAIVAILTLSLLSPIQTFAQDSNESSKSGEIVDVYAMFWPVVPGKTVADPMFWAKQLKETFGGMFSFGLVSKSNYQIELSEKRLVEANKLLEDKDYANALKSLDLNEAARGKAVEIKKKALEEKADTLELTNRLVKSLQNQEKALKFLVTQVPEDQKGRLDEIIKDLPLQISEAK